MILHFVLLNFLYHNGMPMSLLQKLVYEIIEHHTYHAIQVFEFEVKVDQVVLFIVYVLSKLVI